MHPRIATVAAASVVAAVALAPAAWAAPTTSDARAANQAVAAFRPKVTATLDDYRDTYGTRLNDTERARVDDLVAEAEASLRTLQSRTRATLTLARSGAPRGRVAAAAHAADLAYERAHQSAEDAIAVMQPVLIGRLSLFEALRARSDVDRMMSEYEAVGRVIASVAD